MIDPEWLKLESLKMVLSAKIELLLHSWVAAPLVEDGKVVGAILESKEGRVAVRAKTVVDTTGDGSVDHWSDWKTIKEEYDHISGFAKQVKKVPATMDLSGLPACFGVQFEVKITDTTKNKSKPMIDKVTVTFDEE